MSIPTVGTIARLICLESNVLLRGRCCQTYLLVTGFQKIYSFSFVKIYVFKPLEISIIIII